MTMDRSNSYLEQIANIREMMEKSTRFLSLSGLAGIFAGTFALIGAAFAYYILDFGNIFYDGNFRILNHYSDSHTLIWLIADAVIVLALSLLAGFYFSIRRARKMGVPFWSIPAKQMLVNLFIPIVTGGFLIVILILKNQINYVAPFTLIFYGLGLVNVGKITRTEINYLGLSMIILGLLATIFINHGLFFWAVGFGLFHIAYGIILYRKYERKNLN